MGNNHIQKLTLLLLLLLTAGLVAGCEPAEEVEELELEIMAPDEIPELAPLPACDLAPPPSAPIPNYPGENDLVLDLQPEFDWTFGLECEPMGYHLDVFTTAGGTQGNPDVFNDDTGSLATQYSGINLLPATWHQWRACAIINPGAMECHLDPVPFLTGPMCGPGELVAPTLVYPENGAIYPGKSWGNVYEVETDITYPSGNCIPDGFTIYISETPDFSTDNLNVFSPSGAMFVANPDGLILVEDDSNDVLDCTFYYWKAWALQDGAAGPESETFSFYTNIEGDCFIPFQFQNIPYIRAPQDTNCRLGDTTQHQNVATVFKGDEVEVLAVNPEGTHVRVFSEVKCWLWLGLVDLMLGPEMLDPDDLVPLVGMERPPALPTATYTPTPVPTATFTPVPPQCSDGLDNDADGAIDMRDKECRDANDNDEANP